MKLIFFVIFQIVLLFIIFFTYPILIYISHKSSYLEVRLEFLRYSKVFRYYCNNNRFSLLLALE